MNTLKKIWTLDQNQMFDDLFLTFTCNELVNIRVEPQRVEHIYTREVVLELVQDLLNQRMITFFSDVDVLTVNVNIGCIDDSEVVYIETFHNDLSDEMDLHNRGYDVPKPLHEFMGLENEVMLSNL